jgi:hypothetical protein
MSETEIAPIEPLKAGFDYEALPLADRAGMQIAAGRIKERLAGITKDFAAIGRELSKVKARLPHGLFGDWCKAELGFTQRTAQNYMNAAAFLERLPEPICETVSLLPPGMIYQLASPTAPQAVVSEIIEAAEAGTVLEPEKISARFADLRRITQLEKIENQKEAQRKKRRKHASQAAERAEKWRQAEEARARREKEQAAKIEGLFESHPKVMQELGAAVRALEYRFSSVFLAILTAKEAGHAD